MSTLECSPMKLSTGVSVAYRNADPGSISIMQPPAPKSVAPDAPTTSKWNIVDIKSDPLADPINNSLFVRPTLSSSDALLAVHIVQSGLDINYMNSGGWAGMAIPTEGRLVVNSLEKIEYNRLQTDDTLVWPAYTVTLPEECVPASNVASTIYVDPNEDSDLTQPPVLHCFYTGGAWSGNLGSPYFENTAPWYFYSKQAFTHVAVPLQNGDNFGLIAPSTTDSRRIIPLAAERLQWPYARKPNWHKSNQDPNLRQYQNLAWTSQQGVIKELSGEDEPVVLQAPAVVVVTGVVYVFFACYSFRSTSGFLPVYVDMAEKTRVLGVAWASQAFDATGQLSPTGWYFSDYLIPLETNNIVTEISATVTTSPNWFSADNDTSTVTLLVPFKTN